MFNRRFKVVYECSRPVGLSVSLGYHKTHGLGAPSHYDHGVTMWRKLTCCHLAKEIDVGYVTGIGLVQPINLVTKPQIIKVLFWPHLISNRLYRLTQLTGLFKECYLIWPAKVVGLDLSAN